MFLLFLALLSPTPSLALEVTSCEAKEIKSAADPGSRYFTITAKLRNKTKKRFIAKKESATQPAQVVAGFLHHGDCNGAGGIEAGAELAGNIAAAKSGSAKASLVVTPMERGRNKLIFYVSSDPEGEKYATGLNGPNCGFERAAIGNPKKFKLCKLKALKR